eukprot:1161501-Pelagomonas_calceolata.AAC.5
MRMSTNCRFKQDISYTFSSIYEGGKQVLQTHRKIHNIGEFIVWHVDNRIAPVYSWLKPVGWQSRETNGQTRETNVSQLNKGSWHSAPNLALTPAEWSHGFSMISDLVTSAKPWLLTLSLPRLGGFLDPCPNPLDPPMFAPDEVHNHCCWSGKPEGSLLRTPLWRGLCLLPGPTPWASPVQPEYAELLR